MKLKNLHLKRLLSIFCLCLVSTFYISCLNPDSKSAFPKDTNRITSDELIYEIKIADAHTASQLSVKDTFDIYTKSRFNNSTLQEMLVVYTYLTMSENQILLFEDQFNIRVEESNKNLLPQNEIQEIMDFSFKTVLTEEQFIKYNTWRITGSQ